MFCHLFLLLPLSKNRRPGDVLIFRGHIKIALLMHGLTSPCQVLILLINLLTLNVTPNFFKLHDRNIDHFKHNAIPIVLQGFGGMDDHVDLLHRGLENIATKDQIGHHFEVLFCRDKGCFPGNLLEVLVGLNLD